MALFFKKSSPGENRIENSGRWPVRLTHFYLIEDYEFPPTNFPEIFFVQEGNFLHETEIGTQALREGAIAMVNPGNRHAIMQPQEVVLSRVRYLPEWLAQEYELIIHSPEVVSLFFDQSWFRYPRDDTLHVFTTQEGAAKQISNELEYLRSVLKDERQMEPATRVAVLKLMMLIADEHHRYWRGVTELQFEPEARHALDTIEKKVVNGDPFYELKMARGGFDKKNIDSAFRNLTGMTLPEYAERRRVFHAACKLLSSSEEPRKISKEQGFKTTSEFSKQFQKVFGISPNVYRQKFGSAPEPTGEIGHDGPGSD